VAAAVPTGQEGGLAMTLELLGRLTVLAWTRELPAG
jgi:hypothetical protein